MLGVQNRNFSKRLYAVPTNFIFGSTNKINIVRKLQELVHTRKFHGETDKFIAITRSRNLAKVYDDGGIVRVLSIEREAQEVRLQPKPHQGQ